MPLSVLVATLLALLMAPQTDGSTAAPPTFYHNARFGWSLSYGPHWRSLDPSSGRTEPYQLLLLHDERRELVGFYAIDGKTARDGDVFDEMDTYLADENARGRIVVVERLQEAHYAHRDCASWTLLHLGEGAAWRIVVIPHDRGGTNQIYLVVIAMCLPQYADRFDATLEGLLQNLRFTPPTH